MHVLRTTIAWIVQATSYLIARARPNPNVAAIVATVQTACDAAVAAENKVTTASAATYGAKADRDHADDQLDVHVRAFGAAARERVHSDFRAILYRSYLPHGTTEICRANPVKKVPLVKTVLNHLGSEKDPALLAFQEPLATAVTALEEENKKVEAAVLAEKKVRDEAEDARHEWVRAYYEAYNKVRAHYGKQQREAEKFFLSYPENKKGRRAEEEPEAGETEPGDIETGETGDIKTGEMTPVTSANAASTAVTT